MTQVPSRPSGPSGNRVSALAFGSWHSWDRADFRDVVATLRLAVDTGVTLFDLGLYGEGDDESSTDMVFRRALTKAGIAREQYQLAAKAWMLDSPAGGSSITAQLDTLLKRQGTDHADYLVLGDLMVEVADFTPILEELSGLISSGKTLHWAVNNWSADELRSITTLAEGLGVPAPEYAQHKYGLTRRSVAEGEPLTRLMEETGLTVQASDTFEGGLIFGSSTSRMIGGDIGGTQARIRASVARFREVAASLDASVAQLAIALPLTNPHTSSVLVGSRTLEQTVDNIGAFDLLERCTAEEIRSACEEFWFDKGVVDPAASWGTVSHDDPSSYVVVIR